jgi:hypothetical protein
MRHPRGVALVALGLLAGCGSTVPDGAATAKVPAVLRELAATPDSPVYYLGKSFDGLPLTGVARDLPPGGTTVMYGSCKKSAFGDGGCAPPVMVETGPVPGDLANMQGCSRRLPLRGVPIVESDATPTLFTGRLMVKVYFDDGAEDVKRQHKAVAALRSVAAGTAVGEPLPAPAQDLVPLIDKGCGAQPGEQGTLIH